MRNLNRAFKKQRPAKTSQEIRVVCGEKLVRIIKLVEKLQRRIPLPMTRTAFRTVRGNPIVLLCRLRHHGSCPFARCLVFDHAARNTFLCFCFDRPWRNAVQTRNDECFCWGWVCRPDLFACFANSKREGQTVANGVSRALWKKTRFHGVGKCTSLTLRRTRTWSGGVFSSIAQYTCTCFVMYMCSLLRRRYARQRSQYYKIIGQSETLYSTHVHLQHHTCLFCVTVQYKSAFVIDRSGPIRHYAS